MIAPLEVVAGATCDKSMGNVMSSDRNGAEVFSGAAVVMTGTTDSLDISDGCCNNISKLLKVVDVTAAASDALSLVPANTDNFIGRWLITCFIEFCTVLTFIDVKASATVTALLLKNSPWHTNTPTKNIACSANNRNNQIILVSEFVRVLFQFNVVFMVKFSVQIGLMSSVADHRRACVLFTIADAFAQRRRR